MTTTEPTSVSRQDLVEAFADAWLSPDQNAHLPGVHYAGRNVTVSEAIKLLPQHILQEAMYRVGYNTA